MIRLSENPPSRYPSRPISDASGQWWIAKTKSRQEKAFAFDLLDEEVEYYLPMYLKVTRRRDNNKRRKSILCLFPGYVPFCASYDGEERFGYGSNRIVSLVPVINQRKFIHELEQIYYTIDLGMPLEPWKGSRQLKTGTKVRVEAGPLRGIVGAIVKFQSRHKLVLSVEGLGSAAISVDASLVKPTNA